MRKSIHSRDQELFQKILRNLRTEAGLRQADLAARLGAPQSFVSKYESGERRLDILELRTICRALGVDMRAVVDRIERELNET